MAYRAMLLVNQLIWVQSQYSNSAIIITNYHYMKTYGGVEVEFHALMILPLYKLSDKFPLQPFYPERKNV